MSNSQYSKSVAGAIRLAGWRRMAVMLAAVAALGFLRCGAASAQEPAKVEPAKPAAKAGGEKEKEKILPPEKVTLNAPDMTLTATYFPGPKGKDSVPVVLLHMFKRNRNDYDVLAKYLQSLGHAVLIPDLRGHGESATRMNAGTSETLDPAKFTKAEYERMCKGDTWAIKEFLRKENNAGKLNLNKLCVVGAEMGAYVALEFALYDARGYMKGSPLGSPTYGPSIQVGAFVKSLVLISPDWTFKGMMAKPALDERAVSSIPMLILVGREDSSKYKDAKKINDFVAKYHKQPAGADKETKTLFLGPLSTKLQGTALLGVKDLDVEEHIATFIYYRLAKPEQARKYPWGKLTIPHEDD
jgi:pimeloyl-ACP methyl ester carboxylesterase